MTDGRPFDDIRALTEAMPQADKMAADAVQESLAKLSDGLNPLGRNADYAKWLAGWQGKAPSVDRPLITVFAGSHGVAQKVFGDDLVSKSQARVKNMTEGSAGVRGISTSLQAAFKVFELGIEYPAADFTVEP